MSTTLELFTIFHTALSLVALGAGIAVITGLFGPSLGSWWTTLFLVTAIATSLTGFGFPVSAILPSHIVGGVALAILAAALFARYAQHLAGAWRWIFAAGIVASEYLLVFVLIAQAFGKIPALKQAAPTLSEPPFAITQGVALVLFIGIGVTAARRFQPR